MYKKTGRRRLAEVIMVAGLLVMSACGTGDAGMQPTMTIDEANNRVEEYVSRAAKALPAQAKLELGFQERAGECTDPTDGGPKDRVVASRSYNVLGLQPDAVASYFAALRTWWLANNFRILDDQPVNEFLWVENNADGFQMTLKANSAGGIFLLAGSPCVWPDGTPPAQALETSKDPQDTSTLASTAAAQTEPPPQPRRPRRAPVDDEDFADTNWTDEDTY